MLSVARSLNEIHKIPRRVPVCLRVKYDAQIRGRSEHMQQGPESEPLATVFGQAELDLHVLDAGIQSFRRDCRQIGNAEVAADLLIEIHEGLTL